ncbi:unnamed protein product [Calypogeia fissa]
MTLSAFSTASGGRISVSSSAMHKARELLRDDGVENGEHSIIPGIVPSAKPGHEKGKAPLGDDDKENHVDFERNSSHLRMRQLFKTGSGKTVAIERGHGWYRNKADGSGKTVSTSSKAVGKARAYLGEEFEEPAPVKGLDDPVAITAFVTGSGNV